MDLERYSRQTMLKEFGEEGQRKLLSSSVLLVGVGGLGSAVATYLTGAGVGRIGLMDADEVSLSNLQRQILYTEPELGAPKAETAKRRLSAMSSMVKFDVIPEMISEENAAEIISRYDLVVDCCDNFPTRFLLDDVCAKLGKTWIHGTIGEFHGQVTVFNYKHHRRYEELYPERDALCALPRKPGGVIGVVPGIVGCVEAAEAIKILAGFGEVLENRLFTIDVKDMVTAVIDY